ncbi:Aspartate/methionine/tyrosine aminotransferase [Alkalispirochaeta americana]|uniref:Aspartate/methionine/tyrosine aminotransferase n=1 Tax=Alkalispirochaeta americana TaxID=159291 RepID=A0A1N6RBN7_9SPIO|nr:aminotransferase class I/II-fold pyridoxal phosphate-dependent enzyme [Alkalispirochaeta americana]SIQ26227.1 Aspartate/methionine/tyrosine aminotransferase [Alkalispirochaeta americana]
MNSLAVDLNARLEGSVVMRLFSDLGKRIFFPKGIVAQSAEARTRGVRFDATVGMAYEKGEPMTLPLLRELTQPLSAREAVPYSPTAGIPDLRTTWQDLLAEKNPLLRGVKTTTPVVVPGLTAGISLTADLFVDPGDVVLIPDLFWGNYRLIFEERRQCRLREFSFFNENYRFNRRAFADGARAAAGSGKLVVLLNFPNNPAGFTPSPEDVAFIKQTLVNLAESVPVLLIADDAYFGLVYDKEAYPYSIFGEFAQAHPNLLAVKIDGASKEDFAWGFRVGFLTCGFKGITDDQAEALEKKVAGLVRGTVSNSCTPAQSVLLRLLRSETYQAQKRTARDILQARYETLHQILENQEAQQRAPMLKPLPCNSGYFMSFYCTPHNAEELRLALLDAGVGVISVGQSYLRVAFAGIDQEDLPELYETIFSVAEALGEQPGPHTNFLQESIEA